MDVNRNMVRLGHLGRRSRMIKMTVGQKNRHRPKVLLLHHMNEIIPLISRVDDQGLLCLPVDGKITVGSHHTHHILFDLQFVCHVPTFSFLFFITVRVSR